MTISILETDMRRSVTWAELGSLARLAPSPHNAQPYRIRPRNDHRADIVLLTDRLLPREDHGNLYVASAFGIFAATLVRAGLHFGVEVCVTADPLIDPSRLEYAGPEVRVGEATIRGAVQAVEQARLLDARRTSRIPYDGQVVEAESILAFTDVASRRDHRFVSYSDDITVRSVLRLNADAIIDNLRLDAEREEIRPWYRAGETPAHGDGLWETPMNQTAWTMRAAFDAPRVVGAPGIRQLARWSYVRTQRGTRHVGLLCGRFGRWRELVSAGEMLLELWLTMAARGVYMHPMGSMLTNPRYAREIAARFGVGDCWLVFRFGRGAEPPRAPRIHNIVISE